MFIPLDDCINGGLYRISSRNLRLGVFVKDRSGFIGIREKFGTLYLFTEYHRDGPVPMLGTVSPREYLGDCPVSPLEEDNKLLFAWLQEKETHEHQDNTLL